MFVDPQFEFELNKQTRDPWAVNQLFQPDEVARLRDSRCGIVPAKRNVVYAVFENPFARGGGIYAVAKSLPPALAKTNHQVVIVSPFHSRLDNAPEKPGELVAEIKVRFAGVEVPATVYRVHADGNSWLLIHAADFFNAEGNSPYNQPDESLLKDGLFAAAAIPQVLNAPGVDLANDVVVHVQDWQLSAVALTVKEAVLAGILNTAAVVLTSHNPYDFGLRADQLAWISDRVADDQWARPTLDADSPVQRRATMYECMMPLMDAPLSTVSRQYACDLTTSPLQTVHFADHLQDVFHHQGLVGVDNGLFMAARRPFSQSAERQACHGDDAAILREKSGKRHAMLQALSGFRPPQSLGFLRYGDSWNLTNLPDQVPVFMMFGRMDPGQKGFDLLANAIRRMEPGSAKFVICPIVPAGVESFLRHWHDVAYQRPGDVIVYTTRMRFYVETMAGASFCVMPSLHEPFGAATEPYLQGTPVVAHATGGLIQQVVDYRRDAAGATGLLFRHQLEAGPRERGEQWHEIMMQLDPTARMQCPLYVSLVNGLTTALQEAVELYRSRPHEYARMLANLFGKAIQFSWEKAGSEYNRIYDKVSQ